MPQTTATQALTIGSVLAVLWNLRKVDENMTVSMAYSLLLIADDPEISLKDVAARCGIGMSTASRHVKSFLDSKVVNAVEDSMERRKKKIFLTSYGQKIVQDILGGKITREVKDNADIS
jgi:DNA-binding MarR family transcriptional regulator